MTTFLVSFGKGTTSEAWKEVALHDGWICCKNEHRTVYYPAHVISNVEQFEDTPEPSEVRVSWDELERRRA